MRTAESLQSFRWTGTILGSFLLVMPPLVAFGLVGLATDQPVMAQDEDDEETFAEEEEDNAVDEVVGGDEPEDEADDPESVLEWAFRSLGWSYSAVFLSLSFLLVALFVMNTLAARRQNVIPAELVQGFEQHLDERRYQEAYDLARNDESFLGHVLSAGLSKLSTSGYQPAIEAMQEVGEEENMKLDHRLSYMALIGTISPMIGLFGTVHGMINAFQVIASSNAAPQATELAKGISTALFTTLVGLFIAIPAIAAYNILRNWVARLVLEVGIVGEGLMSRFQNVGMKKPQQPQTPSPPQSPPQSPPPPLAQP